MDSSLKNKLNKIIQLQDEVRLKPYAFLEQVTYLIVLKLIDKKVNEMEEGTSIIKDEEIFYDQADRYRWSNWINKPQAEMVEFFAHNVIPYMASIEDEEKILNEIFNNTKVQIESREVVFNLVSLVDGIDFANISYEDRIEFYDHLIDKLLKEKDFELAQYWTPRKLSRLIIELLSPQPDDEILEPACGSGGLITEYIDYLRRNNVNGKSSFENITGVDISRSMIRLTLVGLLLRKVKTVNILRADFLKRGSELGENFSTKKFDIVFTHPPFKGIIHPDEVREDINVDSKRTEVLYLEAIRNSLADGGYAAVIMPNNILFASMRDYREARMRMLENNELLAIISLPEGMFNPHTSISANLLILRKANSQIGNKVWFYDFNQNNDSFDLHFNEVIDLWNNYKESGFQTPPGPQANEPIENLENEPFFWWASYDQIQNNDFDLTFNLYRPILSDELEPKAPLEIIDEIKELNERINVKLSDLESKVRELK